MLPLFAQRGPIFAGVAGLLLTGAAAAQAPQSSLLAPLASLNSSLKPKKAASASAAPSSRLFAARQLLRDLEALSADAMEGRQTGSRGAAKAREYISKRFTTLQLKPFGASYLQPFDVSSRNVKKQGVNLIGHLKGTTHPERAIVITAHYDHLGMRGKEVYNGADDNASGTAALFAIASYFAKSRPAHSLIFVAFDGEEMGLLGSRYFVSHLPLNKSSIVLNINMDMIAHNEKSELYATGTYQNPLLKPYLQRLQKQVPVKLLVGHDDPKTGSNDWTSQSDQGSFYDAKIPFIYFGVEDHKDYHRATDDFATIHPKFYVGAVETIVKTVEMLDKALK